jgi:hypothetical protein
MVIKYYSLYHVYLPPSVASGLCTQLLHARSFSRLIDIEKCGYKVGIPLFVTVLTLQSRGFLIPRYRAMHLIES